MLSKIPFGVFRLVFLVLLYIFPQIFYIFSTVALLLKKGKSDIIFS